VKRRIIQIAATILTNPYIAGFLNATIYKGPFKFICHPGMQCYSCPSSITACPIGALQNAFAAFNATITGGSLHIGLYVIGFFGVLGMGFGRLICGWVCPFGFIQDLLYKIPTPKYRLPSFLSYGKYISLFLFVIFLTLFLSFFNITLVSEEGSFNPSIQVNSTGETYPWFCKAVCPAGTFEAGIPKMVMDPKVRESLGFWFGLKWIILIVFLFLIIITPRAFCRFGCPIGAIYGFFNKISFYKLKVDKTKCTTCNICKTVCPADLTVHETPNHPDCIRCLDCVSACKNNAIQKGFFIE